MEVSVMDKKRRKYTMEFKEEAVKLIMEQGYQVAEAARNLGINASVLGRWRRELEGGVETSSGLGNVKRRSISYEEQVSSVGAI